jgi:serine protease Do
MRNTRKWLTIIAAGTLLACCTQGWAQDRPGAVVPPSQSALEEQELADQLSQRLAVLVQKNAETVATGVPAAEVTEMAAAEAQEEAMRQTETMVAPLTQQAVQMEEQAGQVQAIAPEEIEAQLADMGIDGDQMAEGETGWAGVEVNEVDEQTMKELKLSAEKGVVVESAEKQSPAEKAGLQKNDVILEYDHQPVAGTVGFRRLVRETPPGRKVDLEVWRHGQMVNVTLEVGDRGHAMEMRLKTFQWTPESAPKDFEFNFEMPRFMGMRPVLGITAEDLSGQLGSYFGAPGGEGVLVREVEKGTPAEKAGLKAGDVITKMNGKLVKSVRELREGLQGGEGQNTVTLGLLRRGTSMILTVPVEAPPEPEKMDVIRRVSL